MTARSPNTEVTMITLKNIDLIIVGTHGRGAVGHMLMGSVAERVVRTVPCLDGPAS
jgi:nucleotide-binding universal stress UspA family protein